MTTNQSAKAKLFALYLGQKVLMDTSWVKLLEINFPIEASFESTFLQLRSIADLTDEELVQVIKLSKIAVNSYYEPHFNDVAMGKWIVSNNQFIHDSIGQYLRSIGIALPFTVLEDGKPVTYSVEQQVEMGFIKLK